MVKEIRKHNRKYFYKKSLEVGSKTGNLKEWFTYDFG